MSDTEFDQFLAKTEIDGIDGNDDLDLDFAEYFIDSIISFKRKFIINFILFNLKVVYPKNPKTKRTKNQKNRIMMMMTMMKLWMSLRMMKNFKRL